MSWFLLALVPPLLYAMTNHLDKFLLEKYFKEGGPGTLILFSSLLSVLAIPIILVGDTSVLDVSWSNMRVLALVGFLNVVLLWSYLQAMSKDEASVVIVFYQLVPVLGLLFGYLILGESINNTQLVAMCVILLGSSILSVDQDLTEGRRLHFRTRTTLYMLLASSCWALESVLIKFVSLQENVWRSLFWEHVALVIVGIIMFLCISHYRRNFIKALQKNSRVILSFNILNEVLYMLGNAVAAFAFMLAPVALILLTQSFQPIFVLILGTALTILFPHITKEKIDAKHLWQKGAAIIITGLGTFLLLSTT